MNESIKKFLIYIFIAIILSIPTLAYSTNNLTEYYSLEDTTLTQLVDTVQNNNLTGTGLNYQSRTAKILKGIYHNGTTLGSTQYNTTIFNIDESEFSINFWINHTSTGSDYIISIKNDTGTSYFTIRFGVTTAIIGTKGSTTSLQENTFTYTTANNYSMITVVYSPITTSLQTYVNGILQVQNVTVNPLRKGSNKLYLGIPYYNTIDELSIWNTALSSNDISILLNNNAGLSYTETMSFNNSLGNYTPYCINNNTYCNQAYTFGNGEKGCYGNNNITYCNAGCYNDICYNTQPNGCEVQGSTRCVDSTSYEVCDLTVYGNLDYTTITTCTLGTYCYDGFYIASCKNVSNVGTHANYGIKVTPYSISDENTTYVLDVNTRNIKASTVYDVHLQDFYQQGTNYFARVCDYTETLQYTQQALNITNFTSIVPTSAIGQNAIIRMKLIPRYQDNGTIAIKSQAGTTLTAIIYSHNITDKSFCIKKADHTQLYCDYDYGSSDTLSSVDLEYTIDFDSKTYTIKMTFNRDSTNIQNTYPITFSGNDIYSIDVNATETIVSFTTYSISDFTPFWSNNAYDPSVTNCAYAGTGTYLVRTYGNNDGTPDYSSYTDYTVNVAYLGLSPAQIKTARTGDLFADLTINLSATVRYILVFLIVLTIIVAFTTVGFSMNNVKPSFITGLLVSTFALFIFTVLGWIPVWLLIMLFVVGIGSVLLMGRSNNNASGGV